MMKRWVTAMISVVVWSAVVAALIFRFSAARQVAPPAAVQSAPPAAVVTSDPAAGRDAFSAFRAARLALPERGPETTIAAVGDVMLSRTVAERMRTNGFAYPFLKTTGYLRGADLAFGNLETPITPGREIHPGEMSFRADPGVEDYLRQAGFGVLSLANNHTPNFGQRGLNDTFRLLTAAGIRYAGAGPDAAAARRPDFEMLAGQRFAFLAYNDSDVVPAGYQAASNHAGTAFLDLAGLKADVADAKRQADVVIVSMHSGTEYAVGPNPHQTEFAHAAIDAGADLVIGHHPHVVQPIERYAGKLILYSLGNFVFDQAWSRETSDGLAVRLTWAGRVLERVSLAPLVIEDLAQPRFASGTDDARILARLGEPPLSSAAWAWNPATSTFEPRTLELAVAAEPAMSGHLQRSQAVDLDGNGAEEVLNLKDGRLTVQAGPLEIWRTGQNFWVDDFAVVDADADGRRELFLSYWSAGESLSGDISATAAVAGAPAGIATSAITNRHALYEFSGGQARLLGDTGPRPQPTCGFFWSELRGNGRPELVELTGKNGADSACRGRQISVSAWDGIGWRSVWAGPLGDYAAIFPDFAAGQPAIGVWPASPTASADSPDRPAGDNSSVQPIESASPTHESPPVALVSPASFGPLAAAQRP